MNVFLKPTVHNSFAVRILKISKSSATPLYGDVCLFTDTGKTCLADVYMCNLNTVLETYLECLLSYVS